MSEGRVVIKAATGATSLTACQSKNLTKTAYSYSSRSASSTAL